jgi:acyl-CoA synthetase (NDP forming)
MSTTHPPSKDFRRLFCPSAIAIIGASANEGSISGQPLKFLRGHNYSGAIYPVNPRYQELAGLACYPDILSLPAVPDVALVAVAARRVPDVLRQCGEKGIAFAIVLTSGFAESGEEGARAQAEIAEIARRYDIGVIGPNCQGMMNIAEDIYLGFGTPFGLSYRKGSVSLTSQSGAFGNAVLMLAEEEGLGFRHYLSTGNESCTTTLDLIDYFIGDAGTEIVAAYVEGFKDAQRVVALGRKALAAGKPLLLWKVGNSEAGAKAAASHTANLGGAPALYRAAFKQAGVIEVTDVTDLADCAQALLGKRLPRGNRIAVITLSGGAGILMADRCAEAGLELPALAPDTLSELRSIVPAFAALNNPIDLTAGVFDDPNIFRAALRSIAADPNVDMIGMPLAAVGGKLATMLAREVAALARERDIPILVAWNAPEDQAREAYALLAEAGIARYRTPVRCARAFSALWQYAQARRRLTEIQGEQPLVIERPQLRTEIGERKHDLAEFEAKRVLAEYGIPVTREALATTRDEAVRHANEIGFPVALKIQSADIPHKTEAGGVRIGLDDAEAVASACEEILDSARRHAPDARFDGVLVQEMVAGGTEVILGINNDPLFGPAIMFGLGGIFAEVLKDVTFRLAPITSSEAHEMIREIRAFKVLDGARGRPKADIPALADAIVRLSALAMDLRDVVAELDINPLFVLPAGFGVKAADALIKPVSNSPPLTRP